MCNLPLEPFRWRYSKTKVLRLGRFARIDFHIFSVNWKGEGERYLFRFLSGAIRKRRFRGLGGGPGLIFMDFNLFGRLGVRGKFFGLSVAILENLGSEAWDVCEACFS